MRFGIKASLRRNKTSQKCYFPKAFSMTGKIILIEPSIQILCSLQSLKCQEVMRKIKSGVTIFLPITPLQYPEGDLNPHTLRHTPLKRTCLPIPTSGQKKELLKRDAKIRISKQEEIKLFAENICHRKRPFFFSPYKFFQQKFFRVNKIFHREKRGV